MSYFLVVVPSKEIQDALLATLNNGENVVCTGTFGRPKDPPGSLCFVFQSNDLMAPLPMMGGGASSVMPL